MQLVKVVHTFIYFLLVLSISSKPLSRDKRQIKSPPCKAEWFNHYNCRNMDLSTFCVIGNKLRRVLYDEKFSSIKFEKYAHLKELLEFFFPPYRDTTKISKAGDPIDNSRTDVSWTIETNGDLDSRRELLGYYIWCNDQSCDNDENKVPKEYPAKFNWYTVNDQCRLDELASDIFPVEKIEPATAPGDTRPLGVFVRLNKSPPPTVPYYQKGLRNPFKITITEIKIDGRRLANHLHFTLKYERNCANNFPGCDKGIRAAFIIVHDQNGWPVGDFNTGVPCGYDCPGCNPFGVKKNLNCHQAEQKDTFPCSYVFEDSVAHPGQFMKYFPSPAPQGEEINEIHATWRFAQSTSTHSFTTQIHVKSFVVLEGANKIYEDEKNFARMKPKPIVDAPTTTVTYQPGYNYWDSATNPDTGTGLFAINRIDISLEDADKYKNACNDCPKFKTKVGLFGWNAKYDILWPTNRTIGAWDHVPRGYIDPTIVKCHEKLDDDYYHTELYPDSKNLPRIKEFFGSRDDLYKLLTSDDPDLESYDDFYHGVIKRDKLTELLQKEDPKTQMEKLQLPTCFERLKYQRKYNKDLPKKDVVTQLKGLRTLEDMEEEERCRCAKFGTDQPDPRHRVPPVSQLEGRRDHALQMIIAWTLLVPFAMFVSRYFKETFNKVFFLQEFWWYTMHVLTLILAFMFMIGGIYAIEIKRTVPFNWHDRNQVIHAGVGAASLICFAIHLCAGIFRAKNLTKRRIQIALHWLMGVLEYVFAVFAMGWASQVKAGCMSCTTLIITIAWIFVQLVFYAVMEIHIRRIDQQIGLDPPRSYLPPPLIRIFHRDAPGSRFRIFMLIGFISTCGVFYVTQHITIMTGIQFRSCFNYDVHLEEQQQNFLIDD